MRTFSLEACLVSILVLLIVGCGGNGNDEGSNLSVMNRGLLHTVPNPAACGESAALVGENFVAETELDILRLEVGASPRVANANTNLQGSFVIELSPSQIGDCIPGGVTVLVAGETGTAVNSPRAWPRAVHLYQPSGTLSLEPQVFRCGEATTLSGNGFPPGSTVRLRLGDVAPFSDDFVPLGSAIADERGEIEVAVDLGLGDSCLIRHGGVIAQTDSAPGRWAVEYVIIP